MCFQAHASQPEVAAMGLVARGQGERLLSYVGDTIASLASRRVGPASAKRVIRAIADLQSALSEVTAGGSADRTRRAPAAAPPQPKRSAPASRRTEPPVHVGRRIAPAPRPRTAAATRSHRSKSSRAESEPV